MAGYIGQQSRCVHQFIHRVSSLQSDCLVVSGGDSLKIIYRAFPVMMDSATGRMLSRPGLLRVVCRISNDSMVPTDTGCNDFLPDQRYVL